MRVLGAASLLLLGGWLPAAAQPAARPAVPVGAGDPVAVFTEHPRLLLRPARLRLLQRERGRSSVRWQQLDAFWNADAPFPEPGLAQALYYQVSGNAAAARRAIAWALGPGADLRQMAFVFDWCQKALAENERRELIARMERRLAETAGDESIAAVRSRVLAAVALFDDLPAVPNRELERVVHQWWGEKMAPAIAAGRRGLAREDAYAFWELLHALRENANIDLRESCPRYFKDYPIEHLMSHYPASYRGEENDFRIGATRQAGEPDLRQAAFSRAAELAMVAYDTNAEESQYLQGWLMHDNFMLRGPLGAPYEFLWANPYQPGLGFTLLPLIYHNAESGKLFVRSDWEESADWLGYFDGAAQWFHDGRITLLDPAKAAPLQFASGAIYFGAAGLRFRTNLQEGQQSVILAGLAPRRTYRVEIDDEEVEETATDAGGILVLDLLHGKEVGVRLEELR